MNIGRLLALALVSMVVGCSRSGGQLIRTAEDLKGVHVAHLSSEFHRAELRAMQPQVLYDPYTDYPSAFASLRQGKIGAISLGRTYADLWMSKFPGEFKVAFDYADDQCSFLLVKKSPFTKAINAEIVRMNESGEMQAIVKKWKDAAMSGHALSVPDLLPVTNGAVLRVAAAAQAEPWCYVASGKVSGTDIEILGIIAGRIGAQLEIKSYDWIGMISAINGGKADISCGGIYTAGLEFPTVDTTECYSPEKMCILVRSGDAIASESMLSSLKGSFLRTFVEEERWRMMTHGLYITLLITICASILGTLLAFPVWYARTSSVPVIAAIAKLFIALMQGTPIMVLLMAFYYLFFANVKIDGVGVAIIAFGLNASAYIGETLRSGISAIPRGQTEAALALGYSPCRAFFKFVLPQAVRNIIPVYRGEIVGLLKETAIVGYIAIDDLNKASDLIRCRTYESFFPIITTAIIYFAAAWMIAYIIDRVGRRFDIAYARKVGKEVRI